MLEKHEPQPNASRTSQMLLKIPSAYIAQLCMRKKGFLFLLFNVSRIARTRTDDVGCVHYISTAHSCDVRRVLYGHIMNSF